MQKSPYIVGMGASAGGLLALKDYFKNKNESSGESYVIVVHSLRTYKSKLAEILARDTGIPIQWVEDGQVIQSGVIYINPPDKKVQISQGKLFLIDRQEDEIANFTINHFFQSLASDAKEKAIGVIMSGTGSDGTEGGRAIENHGGTVIVQDPSTAQFDGMPLTSIRYDHPDYICAPEEMPRLIDSIVTGKEDQAKRKLRSLSDF